MPRRPKGPRLYLRAGRVHPRSGKPIPDVYYIRDGSTEVSTGCGPDSLAGAEQALAAYIAEKWTPGTASDAPRTGDPASIYVAEVAALYLQEKAPKVPDPVSLRGRFKALLGFWSDKTLADVKRSTCQAYVEWRTQQPIASAKDPKTARRVSDQAARRELEDLSAAIGHWAGEYPLNGRPKVTLPEKPPSPRDALTRDQAARLLKAAMGWRLKDGKWERISGSGRANRAHLKRFILIGLYTGTRPGVIPKLLWTESPSQAWVDTDAGVIYRRGKAEKDHRTKRRPMVRVPTRLLAHLNRWARIDAATDRYNDEGERVPITTVLHHGGRPLAGKIRRGFESCVRDAGLPEEITPHWMRHTCATWLMEGGADPWEAAGFTGMTIKTLEECYGHHRPDHQMGARKALGGNR